MYLDSLLIDFLSKKCTCYKFTKFIVWKIAKEFNLDYDIKIKENYYLIKIGKYEIIYDDVTSSRLQPSGGINVYIFI
ncbi:hypothetical protein H9660_06520, partial [Clostridium sp. Sa3CUN1]